MNAETDRPLIDFVEGEISLHALQKIISQNKSLEESIRSAPPSLHTQASQKIYSITLLNSPPKAAKAESMHRMQYANFSIYGVLISKNLTFTRAYST